MVINKELLDSISAQAKANVRLRMNYNLHEALDSPSQRLINALEMGTKIPIHRHQYTSETYILIRGSIKLNLYDAFGNITESVVLSHDNGNYGFNIPKCQWHSLEVLSSDTAIFEAKDGPYKPLSEDDILN